MHSHWLMIILVTLFLTIPARGQTPWQFQWQKGTKWTYKVKHRIHVSEVVEKLKSESISKLDLVKCWQVVEVDEKGVATLEMSLLAMRNEQSRTSGDPLLFDSQDLEKSTPELREQMSKYIGKRLAILRVDRYGRVVQTKLGSAARYEAEPPFFVVFPDARMEPGQTWHRPYQLVMEPPQGTGEKYQAEQVYACKKIEAGKAYLTVVTQFKTPPDNMLDRLPLLQKEIQGEIIFDVEAGRPVAIELNIDRTIEHHQGKGSSYRFESQYSEKASD